MNTGRVGGKENMEGSKKVKIPHSSAVVKGVAEGTISWTDDDDFGYEVATAVPGIDDPDLLQPRGLYETLGRSEEYRRIVERLISERRETLEGFPQLSDDIRKAVG
jgi:phosphoenolpyruvate carboxykinase (ATP)